MLIFLQYVLRLLMIIGFLRSLMIIWVNFGFEVWIFGS